MTTEYPPASPESRAADRAAREWSLLEVDVLVIVVPVIVVPVSAISINVVQRSRRSADASANGCTSSNVGVGRCADPRPCCST